MDPILASTAAATMLRPYPTPTPTPTPTPDDDRSRAAGPAGGVEAARERAGSLGRRELTPEEEREVQEMRRRDAEVRAHEQAHKAAAGALARGGVHYETTTGPDGKEYAIGGHVDIALREGRTPEETLRIAQQAQSAATAPADPSAQDRRVAARAAAMAAEARGEIAEEARRGAGEPAGAGTFDPVSINRPRRPDASGTGSVLDLHA